PTPPPPRTTLFPYTTLFRSIGLRQPRDLGRHPLSLAGRRNAGAAALCVKHGRHPSSATTHSIFLTVPMDLMSFLSGTLLLIASQDRKSTRLNSSHEWISYAV